MQMYATANLSSMTHETLWLAYCSNTSVQQSPWIGLLRKQPHVDTPDSVKEPQPNIGFSVEMVDFEDENLDDICL